MFRPRSPRLAIGRFPLALAVLALLPILGCTAQADITPVLAETVSVEQGVLQGVRLDSGVLTFKGIPFAAPPTGDLRWRPPQAPSAWEGTKVASEFSASCWQPIADPGSFYGSGDITRNEDCLYLNVWTGAAHADEARPVMVWIHGGGLSTGSGSTVLYDGEDLASRGIVLVTVNYRLGPMGYLAHPDLSAESEHSASGNYGILDQVAALQWVNDNIAQFGGDTERITIFGESAGSWSVNYLTATPLAAGLFQRAIGHSGGIFWPMPQLRGEGSAEAGGQQLADALGAPDAAALREKTPEEIYAALGEVPGLQLVGNSDGWVFPKDVYDLFAAGEQNDVDSILGFNSDEGTALFAPAVPDTVAGYKDWLKANYGDSAEAFLAAYPAANDEEAKKAGYENMADRFFAWQMRTWARLQTETGTKPARMYFFSRVPPWAEGDKYGAYHASEIIYAFNNLGKTAALRNNEIGPFNHDWQDIDRELAKTMSSYWIHFATTGDPNGEGLPAWPVYNAESDQALELGDEVRVVEGLWKERLDVYDAYYNSIR